jgi:hypothetical protein
LGIIVFSENLRLLLLLVDGGSQSATQAYDDKQRREMHSYGSIDANERGIGKASAIFYLDSN